MKDVKSQIVTPAQLEAGAIIPQALDNQYVSDELYTEIVTKKTSLVTANIANKREQEARNEFIRSLIYSSQVVINRAFILNNELLYKYYLPGDQGANAFASLLNQGIIVPYLFKEKNVFESQEFEMSSQGHKATSYLSQFLNDEIKCVKFSDNDGINDRYTRRLAENFRKYFFSLPALDDISVVEMLGELKGGQREITTEELTQFKKHLKLLNSYVQDTFERSGNVTRNDLYKQFLVSPNTNVSDGFYLPPDNQSPYRHEFKKLIDLKYNTNLPDLLNRYSFTPSNMPTRSALKDDTGISESEEINIEQFTQEEFPRLGQMQRRFMANQQNALILPVLSELSLSDVLEIRSFDSWYKFIRLQSELLSNPLSVGQQYENFQLAFENFQTDISDWYYKKYGERKAQERLIPYATVALSIAGKCFVFGMEGLNVPTKILLTELPTLASGLVVKMMMNVINPKTMKIDKKRSYSIEIMSSELEVTRDEIQELLVSLKGSQVLSRNDCMMAEQDRG